eukprot:2757821-Rhodomonas_salina.1
MGRGGGRLSRQVTCAYLPTRMPGTDIVVCCWMSGTDIAYGATRGREGGRGRGHQGGGRASGYQPTRVLCHVRYSHRKYAAMLGDVRY